MRKYPERPVVGIGAVIVSDGRVVLVKRAHPPLMGEWSLPGGAVEVGETLAAAVLREVREETGLQVSVGPIVEVLDRVYHDTEGRVEYHFVIVDYLCAVVGGTLAPSSDAADVCWAPFDDLPGYHLTEAALAVIAKGMKIASTGNRPARRGAQ